MSLPPLLPHTANFASPTLGIKQEETVMAISDVIFNPVTQFSAEEMESFLKSEILQSIS